MEALQALPPGPITHGQAQVVLTDGRGVFMVVVVRDLWLARLGRRPRASAKAEAKRRDKRKDAMHAAVRAAAALRKQVRMLRLGSGIRVRDAQA